MAEVDIEALKQLASEEQTDWNAFALWTRLPAIIAALEDRDRLRAAAEEVRYEIDRQLSLSETPQLRQIEWWRGRLSTALERRDG